MNNIILLIKQAEQLKLYAQSVHKYLLDIDELKSCIKISSEKPEFYAFRIQIILCKKNYYGIYISIPISAYKKEYDNEFPSVIQISLFKIPNGKNFLTTEIPYNDSFANLNIRTLNSINELVNAIVTITNFFNSSNT